LQTQPLGGWPAAFATRVAQCRVLAFGWWPIAVRAPAALFASSASCRPRLAAGWPPQSAPGLFAFGTYWAPTLPHVFGLVPIWLTVYLPRR